MKRTIRIFGKTVPVWVLAILVFVIVGGAAAAFMLSVNFGADITAQNLNIVLSDENCRITQGPGTIESCTISGSQGSLVASGLDDTSKIEVGVTATNNDTLKTYNLSWVPVSPLPAGVSGIDCYDSASVVCDGRVFLPGDTTVLATTLYFADLTPGLNIPAAELYWDYTLAEAP